MLNTKLEWLYTIGMTVLTHFSKEFQPNIIIIGAGPAGIAAASKLYERGFRNVTILEAENRIGGRVFTTRFDNKWIDLGGQWVHGQVGNIVYELASPLGLLEVPVEPKTGSQYAIYTSDGYQIPSSIGDRLMEVYFEGLDTDLEGKNGTVGDHMEQIFDTELRKFSTFNETLRNSLMKLFEGFAKASDGSHTWHDTSARDYVEYRDCPGNEAVNWKDKGYGMIFDLLTKKYPNPNEELPVLNNTLLNTEVVNINYITENGSALIQTSDGRTFEADHVIVTPSLGVLKEQHETLFTPGLPELKVKTINSLAIGAVGKIILSFDEEWWSGSWQRVDLMWEEHVRQEYENDADKKWLLDLTAFIKLPYKPRVLVAWVNGPGCRYMETLPEDRLLNQTFGVLKKFLGKSYRVSRPTKILRTTWYSNRHFRGSYSYRTMESERANVWAEDLAAPLLVNGLPTVLFAGEATNSHHFATVHGAIETGIREANRLIDIYRNILD